MRQVFTLKGEIASSIPGVVYTSPIQFSCQRNYVIIITDGEPTEDRNAILATRSETGMVTKESRSGRKNDPHVRKQRVRLSG